MYWRLYRQCYLCFPVAGLLSTLQRWGLPRWAALSVTYLLFVGAFIIALCLSCHWYGDSWWLLFIELPTMVAAVQHGLTSIQESFSDIISEELLAEWTTIATAEFSRLGQWLLSASVSSCPIWWAFSSTLCWYPYWYSLCCWTRTKSSPGWQPSCRNSVR